MGKSTNNYKIGDKLIYKTWYWPENDFIYCTGIVLDIEEVFDPEMQEVYIKYTIRSSRGHDDYLYDEEIIDKVGDFVPDKEYEGLYE